MRQNEHDGRRGQGQLDVWQDWSSPEYVALPHSGCSKRAGLRIAESMQTSLDSLLRALLPNLPTMCLKNCIVEDTVILLTFQPTMPTATCPACGQQSSRVRSRYWRTLADLPWAEQSVRLRLHLRKFACTNPTCTRRIFAERLPEVAAYARCTSRRHAAQVRLGLALGGEAGARLSHDLHLSTSAATLLRRVRGLAEPPAALPTVVGVDDWAFRKGVCYGTLLVDLQTHRLIDVLPDRTSATVLTWLKKHPQIAILCRDRSREYARAALEGAARRAACRLPVLGGRPVEAFSFPREPRL